MEQFMKIINAAVVDTQKLREKGDAETAFKAAATGLNYCVRLLQKGGLKPELKDELTNKRDILNQGYLSAEKMLDNMDLKTGPYPARKQAEGIKLSATKPTVVSTLMRPGGMKAHELQQKSVKSSFVVPTHSQSLGAKRLELLCKALRAQQPATMPSRNQTLQGSPKPATDQGVQHPSKPANDQRVPFTFPVTQQSSTRPSMNPILKRSPKPEFTFPVTQQPSTRPSINPILKGPSKSASDQRSQPTVTRQVSTKSPIGNVPIYPTLKGAPNASSGHHSRPTVPVTQHLLASEQPAENLQQEPDLGKMKVQYILEHSMSALVGLKAAKKALTETILLPLIWDGKFQHSMKYSGVLLFGPTGVGKSSIVKAVVNECAVHVNQRIKFYNVSLADLLGNFHGETEKNLSSLFEDAVKNQPAVVLIDEIDSLTTKRTSDEKEGNRKIKNHLLSLMDGLGGTERVTVIGTTNRPHDMDTGFIRRFDRRIYVALPEVKQRAMIIEKLVSSLQKNNEVINYDAIAAMTYYFSPADLFGLVKVAYHHAYWKTATADILEKLQDNGLVTIHVRNDDESSKRITYADLRRALSMVTATNDSVEVYKIEEFGRKFATDIETHPFEAPEPCDISMCWTSPLKAMQCVGYCVLDSYD